MKKLYLFILFLLPLIKSNNGFATSYTIINAGLTFSPDSISANVGDTVIFTLATIHTVIEVDQSTWDMNGNTSNGGFTLGSGGGMMIIDQAKTYYYVCGVHFSFGMKGRIFATNSSGINSPSGATKELEIVCSPGFSSAAIKTKLPAGKENSLRILNMTGKSIYTKSNISDMEYFDLAGVGSGIYIVEIRCGDLSLKRKLTISR